MHCSDFLDTYSDFRDGLVTDPRLLRSIHRHLSACPECALHDSRVRRGVMALRGLQDLTPSADFRTKLRARLARPVEDEPTLPSRAGLAVTLMVAAAVALLVYEGIARRPAPAPVMAASVVDQSLPFVVANPGVPFVTFADMRVPVFPQFQVQVQVGDLVGVEPVPPVSLTSLANLPR